MLSVSLSNRNSLAEERRRGRPGASLEESTRETGPGIWGWTWVGAVVSLGRPQGGCVCEGGLGAPSTPPS